MNTNGHYHMNVHGLEWLFYCGWYYEYSG